MSVKIVIQILGIITIPLPVAYLYYYHDVVEQEDVSISRNEATFLRAQNAHWAKVE